MQKRSLKKREEVGGVGGPSYLWLGLSLARTYANQIYRVQGTSSILLAHVDTIKISISKQKEAKEYMLEF